MKKKIITLSLALVMLVLALAILTVLPTVLQAKGVPLPGTEVNGHWLYDIAGNHCGCASPGSDCTWNA